MNYPSTTNADASDIQNNDNDESSEIVTITPILRKIKSEDIPDNVPEIFEEEENGI